MLGALPPRGASSSGLARRGVSAQNEVMSEPPTPSRVAVVGGGPVGLTTALLLARVGIPTTLVAPPVGGTLDRRTAALFSGSVTLLRNLDVWEGIERTAAAIMGIRIIDGRGSLLRAPETLFTAEDHGVAEFGFNVPNASLTARLSEAVEAQANLTVVPATVSSISLTEQGSTLGLADGRDVTAAICIGADGRKSLVRAAAGIEARTWQYPQAAVVATFEHQRPHRGVSTEFHRRHGPLTTVPMPGTASSLVWVDAPDKAEQLVGMTDDDFRTALEAELCGLLGVVGEIGPRGMFALSGMSASALGHGRVALVGEAAHVIPPIGAQGLNLGLRDAAVLAECLAQELGVDGVARYAAARAPDVGTRITAIDGLNRSLLSDLLPTHLLRGAGLFALKSVPALRRIVVQEGLQPSGEIPLVMRPGGLERLSPQPGEGHRA